MNLQPKFRDVDEMLDFIPEDELIMTLHLRELILQTVPEIKEKLSYNVPFYSLKKGICFIWPASVIWGNKKTYSGVRFGFSYGNRLNDHRKILDRGSRKQVYWIDFQELSAIQNFKSILIDYLNQAVEIDGRNKIFS